jgi:hypothetical protein
LEFGPVSVLFCGEISSLEDKTKWEGPKGFFWGKRVAQIDEGKKVLKLTYLDISS